MIISFGHSIEIANDIFWVGSMGTLLSYIPFDQIDKTGFTTAIFKINGKKISPSFNSVLAILGDNKGNLWLGTDYGLYYYNTDTKELTGYLHDAENKNSICDNIISSIRFYGDSVLWIGTTNGLSRFVPSKNIFTNYSLNASDSTSLTDNFIYDLFIDNHQTLWISASSGLSYLNLNNKDYLNGQTVKFRFLKPVFNDKDKSFAEIFTFIETADARHWMGTDNGLFLVDTSLNIREHYSVPEGLPNKAVVQILEDPKGQLWLATENGLSCFNPVTKIFRNFNINDGLQSNEFNTNASYKDKDGNFYFGGINGFNMFHPDSIKVSAYSPKVVITGMQIFNEPVEIDKTLKEFHSY